VTGSSPRYRGGVDRACHVLVSGNEATRSSSTFASEKVPTPYEVFGRRSKSVVTSPGQCTSTVRRILFGFMVEIVIGVPLALLIASTAASSDLFMPVIRSCGRSLRSHGSIVDHVVAEKTRSASVFITVLVRSFRSC